MNERSFSPESKGGSYIEKGGNTKEQLKKILAEFSIINPENAEHLGEVTLNGKSGEIVVLKERDVLKFKGSRPDSMVYEIIKPHDSKAREMHVTSDVGNSLKTIKHNYVEGYTEIVFIEGNEKESKKVRVFVLTKDQLEASLGKGMSMIGSLDFDVIKAEESKYKDLSLLK